MRTALICAAILVASFLTVFFSRSIANSRPLTPCYRPADPESMYYLTNGCQPIIPSGAPRCPFP